MVFAKAFDKVNHSVLIHGLSHYSVQGDILNQITFFRAGSKQCFAVVRDQI